MRRLIVVMIFILALLFGTADVFAAANPSVTIANPVDGSTLYSSNLLISVKITKPTTIRVSAYKQMKVVNATQVAVTYDDLVKAQKDKVAGKEVVAFLDSSIMEADTTTTSNDLTFYTKKLTGIGPGIYKIRVETIADSKVTYTSENLVTVKDKSEEAKANGDQSQPGAVQFLQNLLKSIFGS